MDRVRAAAVRTLFVQIRTSIASGAIVTTYTVLVSLPYTRWSIVLAWAAAQIAAQGARELLRRGWHRAQPGDAELAGWVRGYTALMAVSGIIWGMAVVVLAHPEQPITVALTLCALFGMSGGSVAGQAYNPSGLYALIWCTFLIVFGRLAWTGEWGYILVGVTCLTFALAMTAFGRVQARVLDDGYRIRFENTELVAALTVQTAKAEEARRQAEIASLAKSQFLAAASHDLRQPLYALSLFSSSMDELSLDADSRRVVASIQDSIAVMESLFEGLLDVSKLEAGVVQATLAPVDLDLLFDRLGQVFGPIARERGLDLRMRSEGAWVQSDAVLLERVLANLVANALRATSRGAVLVAARRRGRMTSLEVWDSGIGIAQADQDRIFEEFVQVGNPERDRRQGLGLGLSIARRAAALIDARIVVASRQGRGSRFALQQPATTSLARNGYGTSAAGDAVSAIDRDVDLPILVVEDDKDVRAALGDLLARWQVPFEFAVDGPAALTAIQTGARYGLVISDYRLAGPMNGLEVIEAVRTAHPEWPTGAMLVTGDFDPAILAAAHRSGVPVFHKPLRAGDLRVVLGLA